jgi:DNA-directed RNA polymerase subunit RPC12/RpoP
VKRPRAKYRCWTCGKEWSGYRIQWNPKHKVKIRHDYPEDYGPGECPDEPWDHIYVDWLNWEECRKWLITLGKEGTSARPS